MASLSNRVISIYNRKTSMRLAPAEWEAILIQSVGEKTLSARNYLN